MSIGNKSVSVKMHRRNKVEQQREENGKLKWNMRVNHKEEGTKLKANVSEWEKK